MGRQAGDKQGTSDGATELPVTGYQLRVRQASTRPARTIGLVKGGEKGKSKKQKEKAKSEKLKAKRQKRKAKSQIAKVPKNQKAKRKK